MSEVADPQILITEDWASPGWRLDHIYTCVDKAGERVPFRMNFEQRRLWSNLWYWNLILKCRQTGQTTFIDLIGLDLALWNRDMRCGIIAQTMDDAMSIFDRKICQPYDHLPQALQEKFPLASRSMSELVVAHDGKRSSHIYVDISARSDTLNFLHISEFGPICASSPAKASEIISGSFPAMHDRQYVFVESTAAGEDGPFHAYATESFERQEQGIKPSRKEFRAHFIAWHEVQSNRMDPEGVLIEDEYRRYFDKLEHEHNIKVDPYQRAWYVIEAKKLPGFMKRENPSYWREAFEESRDGVIFLTEMRFLRENKRITSVPWEPKLPVDTFWDLGLDGATAIWFHQKVGMEHRMIRYFEDVAEGMAYYAKEVQSHGYSMGTHYLPHDADMRMMGEQIQTRLDILRPLLPGNFIVVPRIRTKEDGITATRPFLLSCWIDRENCAQGIKCLDSYKYVWDENKGKFRNYPADTWASHGADSIRQGAQGMIDQPDQRPVQRVRRNWRA